MGLENLKSVFQDELTDSIDDFLSNIIISKNGTRLFDSPPQPTQFIATNPTDFSTAVGNNQLPFTPLNLPFDPQGITGGKSFLEGLSWEKLYNKNHTPLDKPGHKGLVPISYQNVNRDKLNIRDSNRKASIFSFSRSPFLGLGQGEPYIVSDIGSTIQNAGSREVPIIRGITDAIRLGLYTSSPAGLQFIARQNLLGLASRSEYPSLQLDGSQPSTTVGPQRFNTFYNPLSTLGAAASRLTGTTPNILIRKDTLLPGAFGPQKSYGVGSLTTGGVSYDVNISFTGGGGLIGPITDASTSFPIAAGRKFKTPGLKSGDKMTLASMITGVQLKSEGITTVGLDENGMPTGNVLDITSNRVNVEKVQNGMPFYFKDLRDNTYIFFRAYIEGLTENISPSYASHNYIGRSETVYTYERAEREISMTLKLVAQTSDELEMIYKKMDRLTSLCYPEYIDDDYGNRMKPPLTKLRYGELFGKQNKELMGYIKSISYSIDQSSTYETEVGKRVPRHVSATIGYQVIHDRPPRLGTTFYGINQ